MFDPVDRYSTFWPRFWAGFIDGLVFLPISLSDNYLSAPARGTIILIGWAVFSYPAYWIYSVVLHVRRGQTVGKKSQRVKVLDISEERIPSLSQALLRDIGSIVLSSCGLLYFLYLVLTQQYTTNANVSGRWILIAIGSANLLWFFLEIVTMLMNPKRRALHDVIAGTVVVRVE